LNISVGGLSADVESDGAPGEGDAGIGLGSCDDAEEKEIGDRNGKTAPNEAEVPDVAPEPVSTLPQNLSPANPVAASSGSPSDGAPHAPASGSRPPVAFAHSLPALTTDRPSPPPRRHNKLMRLISYSVPGIQRDLTLRIQGDATWEEFLQRVSDGGRGSDWPDANRMSVLVNEQEADLDEIIDMLWARGTPVQVRFDDLPWYERMGVTGVPVGRPA
jgi:hypothetical protein